MLKTDFLTTAHYKSPNFHLLLLIWGKSWCFLHRGPLIIGVGFCCSVLDRLRWCMTICSSSALPSQAQMLWLKAPASRVDQSRTPWCSLPSGDRVQSVQPPEPSCCKLGASERKMKDTWKMTGKYLRGEKKKFQHSECSTIEFCAEVQFCIALRLHHIPHSTVGDSGTCFKCQIFITIFACIICNCLTGTTKKISS